MSIYKARMNACLVYFNYADKLVEKIKKLPERLKAITCFIDEGASVADICTDHGYIPVYLAQSGHVKRVIASDKSAGSLESAKRSAARYGAASKIEFMHASGLDGINRFDVDTIVIAGVGGETILSILDDAPWLGEAYANDNLKLILQPQSKQDVLREYLNANGFEIKEEMTVLDRGREYIILIIHNA